MAASRLVDDTWADTANVKNKAAIVIIFFISIYVLFFIIIRELRSSIQQLEKNQGCR
jgi:hypothetical protein